MMMYINIIRVVRTLS